MKIILITLLLTLSQITFAQYQGNCCNQDGKAFNPADISNQVYQVPKIKSKVDIEINFKSIKIGDSTINLDIVYKKKIKNETPIISLNETYGIKYVLGRIVENDINKYVYKILIYKKDNKSNCWRTISVFNTYNDVYAKTMSLNNYSIGNIGSSNLFTITEGWIEIK